MQTMKQPSLAQKVGAAVYVMSMWPELPGVATVNTLMWPYMTPPMESQTALPAAGALWIAEPDDVRRQAAKVLASVCIALLEAAPQPLTERIWTEQAEYLTSAFDVQPPDGRTPSFPQGALHPPANIADWLAAFAGPCRQRPPNT